MCIEARPRLVYISACGRNVSGHMIQSFSLNPTCFCCASSELHCRRCDELLQRGVGCNLAQLAMFEDQRFTDDLSQFKLNMSQQLTCRQFGHKSVMPETELAWDVVRYGSSHPSTAHITPPSPSPHRSHGSVRVDLKPPLKRLCRPWI